MCHLQSCTAQVSLSFSPSVSQVFMYQRPVASLNPAVKIMSVLLKLSVRSFTVLNVPYIYIFTTFWTSTIPAIFEFVEDVDMGMGLSCSFEANPRTCGWCTHTLEWVHFLTLCICFDDCAMAKNLL